MQKLPPGLQHPLRAGVVPGVKVILQLEFVTVPFFWGSEDFVRAVSVMMHPGTIPTSLMGSHKVT